MLGSGLMSALPCTLSLKLRCSTPSLSRRALITFRYILLLKKLLLIIKSFLSNIRKIEFYVFFKSLVSTYSTILAFHRTLFFTMQRYKFYFQKPNLLTFFSCSGWIRTTDLLVMSQTS